MIRDKWHTGTSRYVMAGALAASIAFTPYSIGLFGESPITQNSAAAQLSGGGGGGRGVGVGLGAEIGGVGANVGAEIGGGGASAGADVSAGGAGAGVGADVGGGGAGGGGNGSGGNQAGGENGGSGDPGGAAGPGGSDGGSGGAGSGGDNDAAGGAADGDGVSENTKGAGVGTGNEEDSGDRAARAGADRGGRPIVPAIDHRQSPFASLELRTPAFERYSTAAERNDLSKAGEALWAATHRPVTADLVAYVNEELDVRTALTPAQIAAAANGVPGFRTTDSISSAAEQLTGSP